MPDHSPPDSHCPICGAALDPLLPGGSCPACLWGDLIHAEKEVQAISRDIPEIEGYEIVKEIGRGGMGIVYQARQENPARDVALKIVAPYSLRAAQERVRFMVEIEAMAALTHPAVLPLYQTGEDDYGRPWFTMQLASGGSLAQRLDRYRGDWRGICQLLVTLGGAVQFAHERGILHRDLKPANVLFDHQDHAYIADFGLAKWADAGTDVTRSSQLLGSPAYLAPEAAEGGARATTTASDVYGLGTILYELLTGQRIYDGANALQVLKQILDHNPLPPRQRVPEIPRDLEMITLKALARDPARRYASAAGLAEDLTCWLEGRAIQARAVGPLERLWLAARRHPAVAALSALLMVSLVTGGILLWRANSRLARSLNDAEARVEFMTHELPSSLEPLGRLDLLDSVFLNVAEHYKTSDSQDPAGLARQADFLAQWAQILRPRGQNLAAIERLTQAMENARAAATGHPPLMVAVRSQVMTGWRLGEALIQGRRHEEAEAVLREAAALAATHLTADPAVRILDAQISLEMAFLAVSRGDFPTTRSQAEIARRKWNVLLPELEKTPISPNHQKALIDVQKTTKLLADAARGMGDSAATTTYLNEARETAERLIALEPRNTHFRSLLVHAILWIAETKSRGREEMQALLATAEAEAAALITNDGGNSRWLTDAVWSASALAEAAQSNQDTPSHHRWREIATKRLDALSQRSTTDLSFLEARALFSQKCARLYLPDDWPTARHHYLAQLDARRRIAILNGNPSGADPYVTAMFDLIKEYEGEQAANTWLAEFKKSQ